MSGQHNSSSITETAPLLPHIRSEEDGQTGVPSAEDDAWPRAFILATILSIVLGVLTLIFLVASMIVMSGHPDNYYPVFDIYYYFAPTAGFVSFLPPIAHFAPLPSCWGRWLADMSR